MPHLLWPERRDSSRSRSRQRARTEVSEHRSAWDRLSLPKIGSWLKHHDDGLQTDPKSIEEREGDKENDAPHSSAEHISRAASLLHRRPSRKVVPDRSRTSSEKRDKSLEVFDQASQKRAASVDRRESNREPLSLAVPAINLPCRSAPDIPSPQETEKSPDLLAEAIIGGGLDSNMPAGARQVDYGTQVEDCPPPESTPPIDIAAVFSHPGSHRSASDIDDLQLQEELEAKWILNLSMHFRDMSDREKFFVTYAEEPNKWRRVTVSCDYRQMEPDSLESDLKTLHYQRDKSSRIYEAIRDSLADIQFYNTVTNLKLETADGRLHVHVTEDSNEIIPYPAVSAIDHLDCRRFKENAVLFDSHISGFVYKVSVDNRTCIKKEIPGPDAVDEFLYEINALCSLEDSQSVIQFEGVIIDEQGELIKGLIISYAEHGALVDMIYDYKMSGQLHWERRERWARQIVQGLSEIHGAGFVQGDFTLSNIVIDHNDDAKIIDINRRGCPVGWEPPELAKLIQSGQRISIYIGVKSDLYQLGMVLWAIAEEQDEPERQDRPLAQTLHRKGTDVPEYFKDIIRACLSDSPRGRPSASELFGRFPVPDPELDIKTRPSARTSVSTHRSDKAYIDPATAVDLEDISQHRGHMRKQSSFENINMPATEYPGSSGSYILPNQGEPPRGRPVSRAGSISHHRISDCSPFNGQRSVLSLDDSELENELASLPASRETRWEQIYVDGDTKFVQRGCGEVDVHEFTSQEPKEICITTPPSELDSSLLINQAHDDIPLNTSAAVAELLPIEQQASVSAESTVCPRVAIQREVAAPTPQRQLVIDTDETPEPHFVPRTKAKPEPPNQFTLSKRQDTEPNRGVGSKKSFSDRVHRLVRSQSKPPSPVKASFSHPRNAQPFDSTVLANLEHEVDLDASIVQSPASSRSGTDFSVFDRPENEATRADTGFSVASGRHFPMHQDSGLAEPPELERVAYESERIRHSLNQGIRALRLSQEEERIDERLWSPKDSSMLDECAYEKASFHTPAAISILTIPASPSEPPIPPSRCSLPSVPPPIPPRVSSPRHSFPPSIPMIGVATTTNTTNSLLFSTLDTPTQTLEEKTSSTTVRATPSLSVPLFHRVTPKPYASTTTSLPPPFNFSHPTGMHTPNNSLSYIDLPSQFQTPPLASVIPTSKSSIHLPSTSSPSRPPPVPTSSHFLPSSHFGNIRSHVYSDLDDLVGRNRPKRNSKDVDDDLTDYLSHEIEFEMDLDGVAESMLSP